MLEWYSFLSSTLALSIKEEASWKDDTETAFFLQQLYRSHNQQVWGNFHKGIFVHLQQTFDLILVIICGLVRVHQQGFLDQENSFGNLVFLDST